MRTITLFGLTLVAVSSAFAGQEGPAPANAPFLQDRGTGIATSMFGTYIRKHELIVYPFYEYYRDEDFEYAPEEFGAAGDQDFRGRVRAHEGLFFIGFGLTDNLAVEFEVAAIAATFNKSSRDLSAVPSELKESGLGDVEGQIRWRWRQETERRPELFSYFEAVVPHAKEKVLIGTPSVELKFGTGLIRGFRWGTLTARAAVDYSEASSSHWDLGEYAVEYLKRLSPRWRVYAGIEGTQDEVSLITEAQWHGPFGFVRIYNGLGLTSKATDWTPELGVLFTIPLSR